jgi:FKBP-type peptidyl-prolyl cis-trans isomerase SlyD
MIQNNKVVSIHYTLTDETGEILDASDGTPLGYLHGHQNIIPGLENALVNLQPGDKKLVKVLPEDGYGHYDEAKVFEFPKVDMPPQAEEGMMLELETGAGEPFLVRVVEIRPESLLLDANHPMAGKVLQFEVEIADVRDATEQELAHGHVH